MKTALSFTSLFRAAAASIRRDVRGTLGLWALTLLPMAAVILTRHLTGWAVEVNQGNGFWVTRWHCPDWVTAVEAVGWLAALWLGQVKTQHTRRLSLGQDAPLGASLAGTFRRAPGFLLILLIAAAAGAALVLVGLAAVFLAAALMGAAMPIFLADILSAAGVLAVVAAALWLSRLDAGRWLWADGGQSAMQCLKRGERLTRFLPLGAHAANILPLFLCLLAAWPLGALPFFAAPLNQLLLLIPISAMGFFADFVHAQTLAAKVSGE